VAVLVHPDDFVAWRTDALPGSPEEQLRQVICQIMSRH
jgi:hypothetical protein